MEKKEVDGGARAPETMTLTAAAEKDLVVAYDEFVVTTNIEALRAYVEQEIAPFKGLELALGDTKAFKEAKTVYAALNKMAAAIDKRRIEEIRAMRAPVDALDSELKRMVAEIKAAYREGKDQIDAFTEKRRNHRRAVLAEEYLGMVGALCELVPYETIEESSWLTASVTEKRACDEMFEKAKKILEDVRALDAQTFRYKDSVMAVYYKTLDTGRALGEERRLTEEQERVAGMKAVHDKLFGTPPAASEAPVQEPAEVATTRPEPEAVRGKYVLYLTATRDEAVDVARYAKEKGIGCRLTKAVENG